MKYIFTFIALISLILCQSYFDDRIKRIEELNVIKKNILECISKEDKASPELKKYATENLVSGYKETLIFGLFKDNENDRNIIKICRRKALNHSL